MNYRALYFNLYIFLSEGFCFFFLRAEVIKYIFLRYLTASKFGFKEFKLKNDDLLNRFIRYLIKFFIINKKRLRGYVLLSQAVAHQVPLPLKSLTSVFGMGTGVSSLL